MCLFHELDYNFFSFAGRQLWRNARSDARSAVSTTWSWSHFSWSSLRRQRTRRPSVRCARSRRRTTRQRSSTRPSSSTPSTISLSTLDVRIRRITGVDDSWHACRRADVSSCSASIRMCIVYDFTSRASSALSSAFSWRASSRISSFCSVATSNAIRDRLVVGNLLVFVQLVLIFAVRHECAVHMCRRKTSRSKPSTLDLFSEPPLALKLQHSLTSVTEVDSFD